jgi:hypothetical protein
MLFSNWVEHPFLFSSCVGIVTRYFKPGHFGNVAAWNALAKPNRVIKYASKLVVASDFIICLYLYTNSVVA